MRINFYAPVHFEEWDWENYTARGIGGSETHVCEMSWRLAQRGYDVRVYSPTPEGRTTEWRGTTWQPLDSLDSSEEALWILMRCPSHATEHDWNGTVWVEMQDEDYRGQWTEENVERIDRILALSQVHRRNVLKRHPELEEKLGVTGNGVRVDLFEEIEAEGVEREPHRCIYASSPDRGLIQALLPLWPKVRRVVGDAELHVYYGFDNIDKMIAKWPKRYAHYVRMKRQAMRLMEQPGVEWHGRVGQRELYRAWLQSAVWPYFSDFTETSCITCMEAQAAGAIPVTRSWWAVGENVRHGSFVNGSAYDDPLAQAELVAYTCQYLLDEDLQAQVRAEMIPEARARCHWERIVDQWERDIHGWPETAVCQYAFQHRHMTNGSTLNVGSNCDFSRLRERGARNVDICDVDPVTGARNVYAELVDARSLPYGDGSFDVVILGDILEHFIGGARNQQARDIMREARRVARSKVVVTFPEDDRPPDEQAGRPVPAEERGAIYGENGALAYHSGVTREDLAPLWSVDHVLEQPIRYNHCDGWGVVVRP